MTIQTKRLELIPLTARQLALWAEELPALEKELGITYEAEPLVGAFLDIVWGQVTMTQQDEDNYLYHTFWLLVRGEDRVVVGSADFKAPPNERGEVEIGYGLGKQHEGHGYMTEAVNAMCAWARQQPEVSGVIAETERDNPASQRLLERCGFALYKNDTSQWWRL